MEEEFLNGRVRFIDLKKLRPGGGPANSLPYRLDPHLGDHIQNLPLERHAVKDYFQNSVLFYSGGANYRDTTLSNRR